MLPIRRRLYQSLAGFTPRQLFSALQGAWLEPIVGAIWQENTGVTPTTTGGQTIGLVLDQSQGVVLGPELVSNGTFDTDASGWSTSNASVAAVAGSGVVTASSNFPTIGRSISTAAGRGYRVTLDVVTNGIANLFLNAGTSLGNGSLGSAFLGITTGAKAVFFVATGASTWVSVQGASSWTAGQTYSLDNISVREVLGNHAAQSTAANRPTYQLDSNNLPLTRHDTTDSLVVNLPNLGSGVYSASGSVYFATPQGMSALHNQSMGASFTLPALSTDIYSWIVVPQRLNTALEGRLERYMLRKANLAVPDYLTDDLGEILTDDIGDPLLAG